MSMLSEKYKVPEATIKNMIQDGVISCSWSAYEEVHQLHKQGKSNIEISDITKMSERHIRRILNR